MNTLVRMLSGRRSWIVLLIGLAAVGALFATLPKGSGDDIPTSGLPASAESQRVAALLDDFPGTPTAPGVIVWTAENGELTAAERTAITGRAEALADLGTGAPVRPTVSDDSRSMTATVLVKESAIDDDPTALATKLRTAASDDLPDGVQVRVGGAVGFASDTVNAFAGTDIRLLLITASVVAVLLLITYRSPVLWIVPLVVIGTADGLARFVVAALGSAAGLQISAQTSGILSVLVFGAGTDYALLLLSRYRDELRRHDDRHDAMAAALRGAGPAILASGVTVALALCVFLLANLEGTRALGFACAIGVGIALVFALVLLPPAVVLFGRGLFWPFVPRVGSASSEEKGVWARIAAAVRAHPSPFAIGAVVLVAALSCGLLGSRVGISQTAQLLGNPESVQAQKVLDRDFGAGYGNAAVMLVDSSLARDTSAGSPIGIATALDGVESATPTAAHDGRTQVLLRVSLEPQSDRALATIRELRTQLAARGGDVADTLVGGPDAQAVDERAAIQHDEWLLMPIIGAVVLVMLVLLLRSIVAPVLLLVTVVATLLAAIGLGALVFRMLFGLGLDANVPLFAFLFLVALGVDYNIFLASRAREESLAGGVREGMQRALAATGGVITSAGILLAAVFVVLSVLPVVALLQIGVIVCIGVLLDTLVVRTVLVPALAFLTGRAFFWPSRIRS